MILPLVNDDRKFHTHKFRKGDVLEVKATPAKKKMGGKSTSEVKIVTVQYSPFDDREELKTNLFKQGYLKKQGGFKGGSKSWKKRWIVLNNETLSYYKDESTYLSGKEPKGFLHLDEFIKVEEQKTPPPECPKNLSYFVVETASRKLLLCDKDKQKVNEWISCIQGMGSIVRSDINFDSDNIRSQKLALREKRNTRITGSGSDVMEITTPYSVVWESHISQGWQWTSEYGHPLSIFDINETLGVGASGKVYRASHKKTKFDIAIKVIHLSNQQLLEDLDKEINVLKKCKSPLVVAYYGSFLNNEEVWILMDYCELGSVKDLIKVVKEPLNEKQCGYVLTQVLLGLVYLHKENILHLDIKAANILVTGAGDVRLADFGVSEQLRDINTFIDAMDYVGSPLFMAPEVIRKERYNNKADIWSLGITIIEMVEGRPPNTDINCIEKLPDLANRDPPTFSKLNLWSPNFLNFLACCLVKDQEQRPAATTLLMHEFLQGKNKDDLMIMVNEAKQLKLGQRSLTDSQQNML